MNRIKTAYENAAPTSGELAAYREEFIKELDAPQGTVKPLKAINRRRWIRAAVVAVCLLLVCGTGAYAAGWFTKPFEVVTEGYTIVDKNGNEVNGKMVDVLLYPLLPEELKGKIRDDILAQQADHKDSIFFVKGFSSVKEAVDYLGCDKLEIPHYPCEMPVSVIYAGQIVRSIGWVYLNGDGEKDGMRFSFTNMFNLSKDKIPGYHGFDLVYYDRNEDIVMPDVSEFDTANGINCKVAVCNIDGRSVVCGFLTKNSIAYDFDILCDENDQEKAIQILHDWAEHF